MEFCLLGPLEVEHEGSLLRFRGRNERVLLAFLLLHAGAVVPRERLIDQLWQGPPPPGAIHSLETYISRLRKTIGGDGSTIEYHAAGYRLSVSPEQIDLRRFEALLEEGWRMLAVGEPQLAGERFAAALALWRGNPFPELTGDAEAEVEAQRLEELRLSAVEGQIDAQLELGHDGELIGRLQTLVAAHPLREGLQRRLMLALYRSGRQAEALEVYQQARRRLVDELGIEPGHQLQELQQAILRQDPQLHPVTRGDVGSPTPGQRATVRGFRTRRWRLAAAAIAVLLAALGGLAWALAVRGGEASVSKVAGDAVAVLDAAGGRLTWSAKLRETPGEIVSTGGDLWVSVPSRGLVVHFDTEGAVRQEVRVATDVEGIAAGAGALWATSPTEGTVSRIDLETGQVVQVILVGNWPTAVAYGAGSVWVVNHEDRTLTRISAKTGRVVATIGTGAGGEGIAVGAGAVWLSDSAHGRVVQIDPRDNAVAGTIRVGNEPDAVVAAGSAVWVANRLDGTVSQIDAERGSVRQAIAVGPDPVALTLGPDSVWVAAAAPGRLVRINSKSGVVERGLVLAGQARGLNGHSKRLAIALAAAGSQHRGGELRMLGNGYGDAIQSIDPATVYNPIEAMLLSTTGDGLVAVRREPGADGTRIVPDLAVSLPSSTDGATIYRFQLRGGLRYSDGRSVHASDVRFSLERLFRARSGRADLYSGIVGGRGCLARPTACDLRRGIVSDDPNRTITFHLAAPDPDFLAKLTLPYAYLLPRGTPLPGAQPRPVPATGPYRVAGYRPGRSLVLARNPWFRQDSPARPDGYPDRITVSFVPDTPAASAHAIQAVVAGGADYLDLMNPQVAPLRIAHPQLLHASPSPTTTLYLLNGGIPPFNRLAARRALNFAVDRTTSTDIGRPTCQVLPPGFPAYRPYCPYTRDPDDGRWNEPDLEQARRLVRRSGTSGTQVTVHVLQFANVRKDLLALAATLRQIGYRVTTKPVSVAQYTQLYARRSTQILIGSWSADYPSPADFFTSLFRCGSTIMSSFPCDRVFDRALSHALDTASFNPEAADELWIKLDRLAADRALVVPIRNGLDWTLLSRRVGNYKANPIYGPLLEQLWVR